MTEIVRLSSSRFSSSDTSGDPVDACSYNTFTSPTSTLRLLGHTNDLSNQAGLQLPAMRVILDPLGLVRLEQDPQLFVTGTATPTSGHSSGVSPKSTMPRQPTYGLKRWEIGKVLKQTRVGT